MKTKILHQKSARETSWWGSSGTEPQTSTTPPAPAGAQAKSLSKASIAPEYRAEHKWRKMTPLGSNQKRKNTPKIHTAAWRLQGKAQRRAPELITSRISSQLQERWHQMQQIHPKVPMATTCSFATGKSTALTNIHAFSQTALLSQAEKACIKEQIQPIHYTNGISFSPLSSNCFSSFSLEIYK